MNRNNKKRSRQTRQKQINRRLRLIFAAVLFIGLFAQIFMIARLSAQNKKLRSVEASIKNLTSEIQNYDLALNQLRNPERIGRRAAALGMFKPEGNQLRVVNLPELLENTSAQSAENTSAEEMNQ